MFSPFLIIFRPVQLFNDPEIVRGWPESSKPMYFNKNIVLLNDSVLYILVIYACYCYTWWCLFNTQYPEKYSDCQKKGGSVFSWLCYAFHLCSAHTTVTYFSVTLFVLKHVQISTWHWKLIWYSQLLGTKC